MKNRKSQTQNRHVQTIQKTGKTYKGWMAIGVIAILVGIVMMFFGVAGGNVTPGLAVTLVGLGLYFCARIGAWWNHG